MAVAPVAGYTNNINAAAITVTLSSPTVAGNYALIALSHGSTGVTWTVPSGWTLLGSYMNTTSQTLALFGKILVSGDIGSTITFTASSAGKQGLVVETWSGVDSTTPLGGIATGFGTTSSATRTSPALSCSARCIEIMSAKGTDPGAWTVPTAFTARAQSAQTGTGSVTVAIADSTTDLNGSDAWTLGISHTQYQSATLWLNPAGAAGPTAVASLGQAASGPQFRAGVSAQINSSSVSVTLPSGVQAGDVALAWHTMGITAQDHVAPAGWVQVGGTEDTSSQSTALFRKILTSGDLNTPLAFSSAVGGVTSSGKQAVSVAVYYRVDMTNPIADVQTNSYSGASATSYGAPPMVANSRIIEAAVSKGTDPGAWTPPAGFIARTSVNQTGTGSSTIAVADSITDLDGGDPWTIPVATTQATVWSLYLSPPLASASAIEPGVTVTLVGTGSTSAPGTTITNYSWSWISGGTAPTLTPSGANATFTAQSSLAGITQVFRLTVTDSNGATNSNDITVTTLYNTERVIVGSTETPILLYVVT